MRAIKFRAWWIERKVMLHEVQDFYDTLGQDEHGNIEEPEDSFGGILDNPDKYIVMQFTGLRDKNGKEIYEGDFISCDHCNDKYTVRLDCLWTGFFPFQSEDPIYGRCEAKNAVVIGNIYENPELLK